jgi:hypothetical protein
MDDFLSPFVLFLISPLSRNEEKGATRKLMISFVFLIFHYLSCALINVVLGVHKDRQTKNMRGGGGYLVSENKQKLSIA